ncbi:FAD-dependent monooxygenase [Paralimibaculum aggregatum]|uniref:FAD-dependent monooxygenase n=1 Tax=Paralimibaculum aggregatum TaxID=3036245 RepID=A0ABQ6LSA0_9RHOB|nr:FAD-dependent monooxygenase [Limibaculum sp. NKW23]GMG84861.1 FAD-dependent monooxygenase [Limibaculum sp. NKW23]
MEAEGQARRALVAGGGIGGLAAALALARSGWSVALFEKAERFGEVGAGLQMSPNACKVLRWLGLYDRIAEGAAQPGAATMRDGHTGAPIYRVLLGEAAEARWGAPYLHVHRADLHAALLDAAREAGVELHTGAPVASYGTRPEGARLKLEDGSIHTGAVLIAADGLRSPLRRVLNGPESAHFSGQIAWRGTIPAEWVPEGLVAPEATVWAGPGRHLVTYYLRGRSLVNFVAVEERAERVEEDWSGAGEADRLRAGFAGWHDDVQTLLAAVERPFVWGLFERAEQVRWCDGPVALLGDAAHAMLPFMAQGAAMALEDAAELVRALSEHPRVPDALLAYEAARWDRVTRVQAQSRSNGMLFHKRTEIGRLFSWAPIAALTWLAPGLAAAQLDWLYGHDVTEGLP